MSPPPFRAAIAVWAAVLLLGVLGICGYFAAPGFLTGSIHRVATQRGLEARFDKPALTAGPGLRLANLQIRHLTSGDTLLVADSVEVDLALGALLRMHAEPSRLLLSHARIRLASAAGAEDDTLAPDEDTKPVRHHGRDARPDRSAKVRGMAQQLVHTLLLPARTLPRLDLRDVAVRRIGADTLAVQIARLSLAPDAGGVQLAMIGRLEGEPPVPFFGRIHYARDDRLSGRWTFGVLDPETEHPWPVVIDLDARLHQDRRRSRVELIAPSTLRMGRIAFAMSGTLGGPGPAVHLELAADSLDDAKVLASVPPPVLGPLMDVGTTGSWGYQLLLDLDLQQPDSMEFTADVLPHGLRLDPARTRLNLLSLEQPFTARIHLPRSRIVNREMSDGSPSFRRLADIDPFLVNAVVTNEDGGFFRHRGFNTEAVKGAIADNIRAGAFRRGAGTITMQLVRNLYLGHERTISRKGQEVLLAWILEHLTGVSKQRLLEIYLNIIEWGPGVHGAEEACRYYFGHDARRLSIDEALFLATVVPAPSKWRNRFDSHGDLRGFVRAQMHFIGRAMIAKGWLAPEELPPADQLEVRLHGPAEEVLFPPVEFDGTSVGFPRY